MSYGHCRTRTSVGVQEYVHSRGLSTLGQGAEMLRRPGGADQLVAAARRAPAGPPPQPCHAVVRRDRNRRAPRSALPSTGRSGPPTIPLCNQVQSFPETHVTYRTQSKVT